MNLKEAFRYQNFLESIMSDAVLRFQKRDNFETVTKTHRYSKANPDKQDEVEQVERVYPYTADCLLAFIEYLVDERNALSLAIGEAKASLPFDMDAATEANKFRQTAAKAVKTVLKYTPSKRTEQGRDYKFNAEGNQMVYIYDVETEVTDAYDRETAKRIARELLEKSDEVSNEIDAAKVNTEVKYRPFFSVNNTFEEMIEVFDKTYFQAGLTRYSIE